MPAHAYGFAFAHIPVSRHDARAYPDTQKVRCPAKPPVFEPVAVSVMFPHRMIKRYILSFRDAMSFSRIGPYRFNFREYSPAIYLSTTYMFIYPDASMPALSSMRPAAARLSMRERQCGRHQAIGQAPCRPIIELREQWNSP